MNESRGISISYLGFGTYYTYKPVELRLPISKCFKISRAILSAKSRVAYESLNKKRSESCLCGSRKRFNDPNGKWTAYGNGVKNEKLNICIFENEDDYIPGLPNFVVLHPYHHFFVDESIESKEYT